MRKTFFSSKPRHVTPQIDHLGKRSPVLRVSTLIYGVTKEIDEIDQLSWKNKACSDGFNTHLWGF